jgi:YHS domain-containing protein
MLWNRVAFLLGLAGLFGSAALLAVEPVNQDDGAAIHGYDPVAYFTAGKPQKGSASFKHAWNGATWWFASAAHRDAFAADPTKYAPQYGGYCAYAVAKGTTADIDPEAWKIVEGRLYLNYSQKIQQKWEKDQAGFIAKADQSWPKLAGKR